MYEFKNIYLSWIGWYKPAIPEIETEAGESVQGHSELHEILF